MLKGYLIILRFTGQTTFAPFYYTATERDGEQGISSDEIVMACSERANEIRKELAEHRWDDPRGQGWYIRDGQGTIQGSIC